MVTLSVWRFDTEAGTDQATRVLQRLAREQAIAIQDCATVVWPEGKQNPRTQQISNLAGAGALGGAFWGMLFGLIFYIPLLGAAIGAASGAIAGSLRDVGIDDGFLNRVRDQVTPGTSALFLMTTTAVVDEIHGALAGGPNAELILTTLSMDQVSALRTVFTE